MSRRFLRPTGEPWYLRFHDLMPFRVREVLLVSSPYDAFTLEEDGRLSARLFLEYSELNLSHAPRITHTSTAARAMQLLDERTFDLVITMVHLADMDVLSFASAVRERHPDKSIVLLAFQEAELVHYRSAVDAVDHVFLWTGDTQILVAAIKLIEDERNVEHDTRSAGVRVIIVVEDSIRRFSSFLSVLYAQLLIQAGSLIAEGGNDLHKVMRMRTRPKILLAQDFEEAVAAYRKYRQRVFALISDVRFPRNGKVDPEAGYALARMVRDHDPDMPILLQSAEADLSERAEELGVAFADKNSPHIHRSIRSFLAEGMGFGAFIFRMPDRSEVGRAEDAYEMEQILHSVPAASLHYHASRNHFSLWLMARSMFRLGEYVRLLDVDDFDDIESLREVLIKVLRQARQQEHEGSIVDFSSRQHGETVSGAFMRSGGGSLGGKGRSIAFANSLIARRKIGEGFDGLEIRIPRTVGLGTDEFDRFIEDNRLADRVQQVSERQDLLDLFLGARLRAELVEDLRSALLELPGPIAVRSSSLLEDSHLRPFAGIYSTFMLPNNDPDPKVRLEELCNAVKAVYASAFSKEARSYLAATPYVSEDERMAVVIQQVVGSQSGDRFYPDFAGVACSYNYYPVGGQKASDGVALVAVGLGHTVVSGGEALQFSPRTPGVLPQYPTARDYLRHSQSQFYALDLSRSRTDFYAGEESSLCQHELAVAESDGKLRATGSVFVASDDAIRDTLTVPGPRVVTFNNILKWEAIPLAPALAELLRVLRQGIGQAIEFEFAVDMGDWGQMPRRGEKPRLPCLYVLQVRPQAIKSRERMPDLDQVPRELLLCSSSSCLGHGRIEDLYDVLYVPDGALENVSTRDAAREVGELNAQLQQEGRKYLLIGPGRWGSSDPHLGIPVDWAQISRVGVMVETAFDGRTVEPSQGSHFFHNITAMGIGYITINPGEQHKAPGQLDHAWLDAQPAHSEKRAVRHIRLDHPLLVWLDGATGKGVIFKAAPSPEE
ncbi:MAG: histidine kinase [Deltaproteobacteria bacterium]|nr:histidine kinase [Deltaproteobacteria bacterium]